MSITYTHKSIDGTELDLPVGKVVCVGRNYLDHINELNNSVPTQPLLFIKPNTALTCLQQPISIPSHLGECHNELEIAVLINSTLTNCTESQAESAIWGLGLGLDLTLRELQHAAKKQGHPWERAKAFDGSCPMSGFIDFSTFDNLTDLGFSLQVNNSLRQQGNSRDMLIAISSLLVDISNTFTLLPGDIVLTGTPKGVAALAPGDQLTVTFENHFSLQTSVE